MRDNYSCEALKRGDGPWNRWNTNTCLPHLILLLLHSPRALVHCWYGATQRLCSKSFLRRRRSPVRYISCHLSLSRATVCLCVFELIIVALGWLGGYLSLLFNFCLNGFDIAENYLLDSFILLAFHCLRSFHHFLPSLCLPRLYFCVEQFLFRYCECFYPLIGILYPLKLFSYIICYQLDPFWFM